MSSKRTLAWILAGGAALALGGVAIWWWRRRVKQRGEPQIDADARPSTPVEQPVSASESIEHEPPASEPAPQVSTDDEPDPLTTIDPLGFQVEPTPFEPPAAANVAAETQRGRFLAAHLVPERPRQGMTKLIRRHWPTRPQGPELEPASGDDVAFVVTKQIGNEYLVELLITKVLAVHGDELDVEVIGGLDRARGITPPELGHGFAAGDCIALPRAALISVIKPEPMLIPKTRLKRYRVGAGDLIELRPDTIPELPPDSIWQPSRTDVTLRIVEQDASRSVVALDGPAGEVNIALVTPTKRGQPRTVCCWKFEIVESAA